jgi:hypothetical protein
MNREDLERVEGVELHKDTDPNDPIVGEEAAIYDPLSPMSVDDKPESSRGQWGRLSVHSRATSRSSLASGSSPLSLHPPAWLSAPRRDASRESRGSSRSESVGGEDKQEKP